MRQFRFILILTLGFGLGLVAQSLFAQGASGGGIWVTPDRKATPPKLTLRFQSFDNERGGAIYDYPDGWKPNTMGTGEGYVWVTWKTKAM